jgi:hypothetical protein
MSERNWKVFSALTRVGDDLVLDGAAFVPGLSDGGAPSAASDGKPKGSSGKRPPWFMPTVVAACVAWVVTVGVLLGVMGNSFGFFPFAQPDTTAEDTTAEPTEDNADGTADATDTDGETTLGDTAYEDNTAEDTTMEDTTMEDTSEDVTEDTTAEEPEFGDSYTVEANNYGMPFTILYCSDSFDRGFYFENTDESPTYALGEAAYQRIRQTEKHLGVEILVENGGTMSQYAATIAHTFMAGDLAGDMVLTHSYGGVADLMTGNYLMDMTELDSLSLKADYWDLEGMNALSVKGSRYLGVGDFLLPEDAFAVVFNKRIAAELDLEAHLYTLVRDGGWTLDKMEEYASRYDKDNGDGLHDEDDHYGIACNAWMSMTAFITASDLTMVGHDGDGNLTLDWRQTKVKNKLVELDDFLYSLMEQHYVYAYNSLPTMSKPALTVWSDRVFMEFMPIKSIASGDNGKVSVGILPYPVYDRDQDDYKTLYMGGYMAVMNIDRSRAAMVGDVIETLAYRSADLQAAYDDYLLKGQGEERIMDGVMLETIRESLTYDPAWYLSGYSARLNNMIYSIPHHIAGVGEGMEDVISDNHNTASRDLEKFMKSFTKE